LMVERGEAGSMRFGIPYEPEPGHQLKTL